MHIHTKRLMIKPYREDDCDRMIALLTNEEIKKTYMIPELATRDEAKLMFHKIKTLSESKDHYHAGIYYQNVLIGFVNDVGSENHIVEMGYVIDPDYQKQGFATEAFHAVIVYLLQSGFAEVTAGAFSENIGSFQVMKKCGMKRSDKTDEIEYHGKLNRCCYYSIKAEDFDYV